MFITAFFTASIFLAVKKPVMKLYQATSSNSEVQQESFAARCKSLEAIFGAQISLHLLFNSITNKIAKLRLPTLLQL
jgi:hypothetical protein